VGILSQTQQLPALRHNETVFNATGSCLLHTTQSFFFADAERRGEESIEHKIALDTKDLA
jgi:hypothetical protein